MNEELRIRIMNEGLRMKDCGDGLKARYIPAQRQRLGLTELELYCALMFILHS